MIVTKGDVDLQPVIESLIFDDIVIWDNSREAQDEMTYGRALGALRGRNPIIYSQDDDIIHTAENEEQIVDSYRPGVLSGCMWSEWSAGAKEQGIEHGYDDLVFPGSGSVYDEYIPFACASLYLDHYPQDDFFRLWADTIIGTLATTRQLDIRFEVLPCAEDENRMCNLPDAVELKTEAIMRARKVRDMVPA